VNDPDPGSRAPRSPAVLVAIGLVAALLVAGLLALGVWQVERLAWKRDLIARIDARIHARPAPAPGPGRWPGLTAKQDEYRRVTAEGIFQPDRAALVQASTIRGTGYWVMMPLVTPDGYTLLVNRGFIPPEARRAHGFATPPGQLRITGLLRMAEPGGGFLRRNDPRSDRWYSRDVAAIAAARRLGPAVAPYFIDADAGLDRNALPVGGLTVVSFPNNHLQYALTWFALAAMVVAGYMLLMRWEGTLRAKRPTA
jgi:surfeit locus 1 family protein